MKRVLIVASVASMIDQFNMPNISLFHDLKFEVHVACNFVEGNTCSNDRITILKESLTRLNVKFYQIDFKRNLIKLTNNIKAYHQLKKIIKAQKYDLIHCHSPIGGLICRIAAKKYCKNGTKVIYTAHGFHFYKGAPLKNWLVYYPIEKLFSRWTDVLITINKEDYELAKRKMKAKHIEYISGVGINTERFAVCNVDREAMRLELGVLQDEIMIISVGELNNNKNHETILRAIAKLKDKKVKYFIAGVGKLNDYLNQLALELGISQQLHLLKYRTDIPELLHAADIFCFPSKREGLPVALMEAMASGLPCIASNIRGNVDLLEDDINGYLCNPTDSVGFAEAIKKLCSNSDMRKQMGLQNIIKVKQFDSTNTIKEMKRIYNNCIT